MAGAGSVVSEPYCLLPGDLRDTKVTEAALTQAGFNPQLPTYVLAECVLVYMEPSESAAVVRWLGSFLSTAACVVYEQVRLYNSQIKYMKGNDRCCMQKSL